MTIVESRRRASPAPRNGHVAAQYRSSVSLVVPTLNEAANLPWLFERIPDFVDEVVIVDGQSTDGTVDVALELYPGAVIVYEDRRGKGAALRAGFHAATSDVLVMLDADGSMDPGEIGRFVEHIEAGFDIVKGSRYIDGGGSTDITWVRNVGNRTLRGLVNRLYGESFTDLCYGFFALRSECLPALGLGADGFEIETEIVVRSSLAELRVAEVPSFESERLHGESHLRSIRDGFRVLRTLLGHRFGWRGPVYEDEVFIDLTPDAVIIDLAEAAEAS
jgi:glycosyltransferase involved in cell wall biosynthesis